MPNNFNARMKAVLFLHGHKCWYCGCDADGVDHIMPRSKGGSDKADNLVAACARCNSTKNNALLDPEEMEEHLAMAWIMAPLVEDVVKAMDSAKQRSLERRKAVYPWRVPTR